MRKGIKSVMAFALAATLAASTLAPAATASAASKVNVITKATYNSGSTVKYSYNKKGLITKSVSTSSSKDNDSDTSTTVTTTFKYNKKNKVSTKTAKTVKKVTTYETDKTTGLKIGAKQGTVTTTTTAVTNFTYNKKGLATQSVTTTTTGKTGSVTSTDKSTFITDDESDRRELSDGRILAGYNYYKADGTENDENTVANAYYYEGSAATTEGVSTTTTTYTDNGNGTYTETSTTTRTSAGYKTEPVKTYYAVIGKYVNGVDTETVIPVKYSEDGFEGEREESHYDSDKEEYVTSKVKYTYYYQTADGKDPYYALDGSQVKKTFSITEKVVITADPTVTSTSTSTDTTVNVGKSVTTTKYTYDKKKRVKKAVATTVGTGETTTNSSYSSNSTGNRKYGKTESKTESKTEYTDKSKSTNNSTYTVTTTYTYDKKGRAKKVITSDDGIGNYTNTNSGGFWYNSSNYDYSVSADHSTYNYESTSTDSDGKKTTVSYSYNFGDAYPTTTTYANVGGTQTTTITYNPYKFTYNYSKTDENGTITRAMTDDVTHYGNGGSKKDQTYTNTYAYTNNTNDSRTVTGTSTEYSFDKDRKSNGNSYTRKTTYTNGTTAPYEDSGAYYNDGKDSSYDVAAMTKIDAAKTALEATGTVYNDTETKTVLATPNKNTTTYAYDKKGNVKSAKSSETRTEIEDVKNEAYGNTIYEFDAAGKIQPKEIAVTHKNTGKDAMENTVKKGTKVLTKKLTVNKHTYDRSSSSRSYLSRVLFTIKGKKSSTASLVKKQQWIIQNGDLNGQVGLD